MRMVVLPMVRPAGNRDRMEGTIVQLADGGSSEHAYRWRRADPHRVLAVMTGQGRHADRSREIPVASLRHAIRRQLHRPDRPRTAHADRRMVGGGIGDDPGGG